MVECSCRRQGQIFRFEREGGILSQETPHKLGVLGSLDAACAVADSPVRFEHQRRGAEQLGLNLQKRAYPLMAYAIAGLDALGQDARIRAGDIEQNTIEL